MSQYENVQANLTKECEKVNFTGSVTEVPLFMSSAVPVVVNCSVNPTSTSPANEICWETMLGQVITYYIPSLARNHFTSSNKFSIVSFKLF